MFEVNISMIYMTWEKKLSVSNEPSTNTSWIHYSIIGHSIQEGYLVISMIGPLQVIDTTIQFFTINFVLNSRLATVGSRIWEQLNEVPKRQLLFFFWDWSGIGSVRTIERVLWRNGGNNGLTDWGVQINYMVDDTYCSSLTDVCSNTYNTIQILATLFAAWKRLNKLCGVIVNQT